MLHIHSSLARASVPGPRAHHLQYLWFPKVEKGKIETHQLLRTDILLAIARPVPLLTILWCLEVEGTKCWCLVIYLLYWDLALCIWAATECLYQIPTQQFIGHLPVSCLFSLFNFFIRGLLGCVKHCPLSLTIFCKMSAPFHGQYFFKKHIEAMGRCPRERRDMLERVAWDLVAGCGFSFYLLTHKNHGYSTFPPVFWFSWELSAISLLIQPTPFHWEGNQIPHLILPKRHRSDGNQIPEQRVLQPLHPCVLCPQGPATKFILVREHLAWGQRGTTQLP